MNNPERKEKGKTVQQTVHRAEGLLCRISVDGREKSLYCHWVEMEDAVMKKQPLHWAEAGVRLQPGEVAGEQALAGAQGKR